MFPLSIFIFRVLHHNLHNLYDKKVLRVQPHLKLRNASSLCAAIAIEQRKHEETDRKKNILLSMNILAMNVCRLPSESWDEQLDKIWIQVQHDRQSWLKKNKPIYHYLIHQCLLSLPNIDVIPHQRPEQQSRADQRSSTSCREDSEHQCGGRESTHWLDFENVWL